MHGAGEPEVAMIEERRVHAADADLFVRSVGGGPGGAVLVVLHGGPGLSHDYLLGLLALAGPGRRVVVYDQRGVGRSVGVVDSRLAARQVEDLTAVQDAFGASRVHLLGHSAGGLTVILYAQHRPEAIASAVFVDSSPTTRSAFDAGLERFSQRVDDLTQAGVLRRPSDGEGETAWIRRVWPAYFHDPRHDRAGEHGGVSVHGGVFTAFMQSLGGYDFRPVLAAFPAPALVVTCPTPFGTDSGGSVAEALPAGRVEAIVLDACGHLPWLECPGRFVPMVRGFLDRQSSTTR